MTFERVERDYAVLAELFSIVTSGTKDGLPLVGGLTSRDGLSPREGLPAMLSSDVDDVPTLLTTVVFVRCEVLRATPASLPTHSHTDTSRRTHTVHIVRRH